MQYCRYNCSFYFYEKYIFNFQITTRNFCTGKTAMTKNNERRLNFTITKIKKKFFKKNLFK